MSDGDKSTFDAINNLLKNIAHFRTDERIGGAGKDLPPLPMFFLEFDCEAEGDGSDAKGLMLILAASCLNPVIPVFFAMYITFDMNFVEPIALLFGDGCIADNVGVSASALSMTQGQVQALSSHI